MGVGVPAVEAIGSELQSWKEGAISLVPNLAVAIVVMAAAFFAARLGKKASRSWLGRTHVDEQIARLVGSGVQFAILSGGLVLALQALHLDKAVTTALASVGVIGLALGFALQDLISNLVSGLALAVRRPFELGDVIETNGVTGTVEETGLRTTQIREFSGVVVMIPNAKIFGEIQRNVSKAHVRRIEVAVGCSYADGLDEVEDACYAALDRVEACLPEPEPQVLFKEFGASSIDLEVRFWVPYGEEPGSYLTGRSQAVKAIKRSFDESGLTIPFPIRTVDFGVVGGESLTEALRPIVDDGSKAA